MAETNFIAYTANTITNLDITLNSLRKSCFIAKIFSISLNASGGLSEITSSGQCGNRCVQMIRQGVSSVAAGAGDKKEFSSKDFVFACNVQDTISWVLGEIETEHFRSDAFLNVDIDNFGERIKKLEKATPTSKPKPKSKPNKK